MKKLLILVIALALVGGVAMAQVTVGGIVEVRTQNDFDESYKSSLGDTRLIVSGSVDDYTSVYFRLPVRGFGVDPEDPIADRVVEFDRAYATTNVGALIGSDAAGVGISVRYGVDEWTYADLAKITGYEYEQVQVRKPVQLGTKINFAIMDMVNVYTIFGLEPDDLEETETMLVGLDTAIDVGVGTFRAELVYADDSYSGVEDGQFGVGLALVGAELVQDVTFGFAGSFTYDIGPETSQWGFGTTANYAGLATLGVSMTGILDDDAAVERDFDRVGVNLSVTPLDFLRLDLGSVIGVSDAYENAFDSLDASLTVTAGAAAFRFGYLFVDEDAAVAIKRDLRASFNDLAGGLYMRATVAF